MKYRRETFYSSIVGVTFRNPDKRSRQKLLKRCKVGNRLQLIGEPKNKHDKKAVAVYRKGQQLGYLDRKLARKLRKFILRSQLPTHTKVKITNLTGGTEGAPIRGAEIKIEIYQED